MFYTLHAFNISHLKKMNKAFDSYLIISFIYNGIINIECCIEVLIHIINSYNLNICGFFFGAAFGNSGGYNKFLSGSTTWPCFIGFGGDIFGEEERRTVD